MLKDLQEKRGRLVTEARSALEEITKNTDDARTAELEQRHDTIMADLDKLDTQIAREERTAKAEREDQERRERNRPLGEDLEERSLSGDRGQGGNADERQAEYRDAFMALARTGFDIGEMNGEQRTILRRGFDAELRTQVAGTTTAGGYTVPVILANEIVKTMKDWGPMYDGTITGEINTGTGNEFDIPTNDDTGNSAAALAEGADLTDDNSGDLTFGQKRLDAFVYATPWVKLSFELLQDSAFNLEAFLGQALGERLGRLANQRLTVGSGASQPNGIVTASSLGITAASATAFTPDEVLGLLHSVNAAYRRSPKARWMFADTTLLAIRKMKDGQGNYLWQMGDITKGQPAMLLDHPYSINDDVPGIATGNKAIIFGDFSRYWVRKVGGPLIGTVRERFWPKVGMAGLIRFDGELADAAAVKHAKLA
jgi:HK97 family phage major capsid protein